MAPESFTVRAQYNYEAEQPDDLEFVAGQILTVDQVLDSAWYHGYYDDPHKGRLYGVFPITYVSKITEDVPEPEASVDVQQNEAIGADEGERSEAPPTTTSVSHVTPHAQKLDNDGWSDSEESEEEEKVITFAPPKADNSQVINSESASSSQHKTSTSVGSNVSVESDSMFVDAHESKLESFENPQDVHPTIEDEHEDEDEREHEDEQEDKREDAQNLPSFEKPKEVQNESEGLAAVTESVSTKSQNISDNEPDFKTRLARFNQANVEPEEKVPRKLERHPTFGRTFPVQEDVQEEKTVDKERKTIEKERSDFQPSMTLKERIALLQQSQQQEQQAADAEAEAAEKRRKRRERAQQEALASSAQESQNTTQSNQATEVPQTAEVKNNYNASNDTQGSDFSAPGQVLKSNEEYTEVGDETEYEVQTSMQHLDLQNASEVPGGTNTATAFNPDFVPPIPVPIAAEQPPKNDVTSKRVSQVFSSQNDEYAEDESTHKDFSTAEIPNDNVENDEVEESGEQNQTTQPTGEETQSEQDSEDDAANARRAALRERMARLASSTGGLNMGMLMGAGGFNAAGGIPKRERVIDRSEYESMSPAEIEAAEARREAQESQPISMLGVGPPPPFKFLQKPNETEPTTEEVDETETIKQTETSDIGTESADFERQLDEALNNDSAAGIASESGYEGDSEQTDVNRTPSILNESRYADASVSRVPPVPQPTINRAQIERISNIQPTAPIPGETSAYETDEDTDRTADRSSLDYMRVLGSAVPKSPTQIVPPLNIPHNFAVENPLGKVKVDLESPVSRGQPPAPPQTSLQTPPQPTTVPSVPTAPVVSPTTPVMAVPPAVPPAPAQGVPKANPAAPTNAPRSPVHHQAIPPILTSAPKVPPAVPSPVSAPPVPRHAVPPEIPSTIPPSAPQVNRAPHPPPPVSAVPPAVPPAVPSAPPRAPPAAPPAAPAPTAPPAPPTAPSLPEMPPVVAPSSYSNRTTPPVPENLNNVPAVPTAANQPSSRHNAIPGFAPTAPQPPRTADQTSTSSQFDASAYAATATQGLPPTPAMRAPPPVPGNVPVPAPSQPNGAPPPPPPSHRAPAQPPHLPPPPPAQPVSYTTPKASPGAPPLPPVHPSEASSSGGHHHAHSYAPPPVPPSMPIPPPPPIVPSHSQSAGYDRPSFALPTQSHPLPSIPVAETGPDFETVPSWVSKPNGVPSDAVPHDCSHTVLDVKEGRKLILVNGDATYEVVLYDLSTGDEISRRQFAPSHDQHKLKALSARVSRYVLEAAQKSLNTLQGSSGSVNNCVHAVPHALLPPHELGVEIYANIGNSSVNQSDEIRPGDVCVCDDAMFQGGKSFQKYQKAYKKAYFVIEEWDGTKQKIRLMGPRKESLRLRDLRQGIVKVYRVTDVEYFAS